MQRGAARPRQFFNGSERLSPAWADQERQGNDVRSLVAREGVQSVMPMAGGPAAITRRPLNRQSAFALAARRFRDCSSRAAIIAGDVHIHDFRRFVERTPSRRISHPVHEIRKRPQTRIILGQWTSAGRAACSLPGSTIDDEMGRESRPNSRRKAHIAANVDGRCGELLATIQQLLEDGAAVDDYFPVLHRLASIMKMSMGSVIEPGQILYRATKYHKTVPQHTREISHPPSDQITALGRCNRVGQSIFYCSSDNNCVLEEICPKEGDLVVRAGWRTTKRAFLRDIGYSPAVFARAGTTREVPAKYLEFEGRLDLNAQTIRDFIGFAFTDPTPSQYPLTAAIAEFHLRSDDIVGVMYPSVTRKGDCDNVVLRPEFVDGGGLELVSAEAIRVRHWDIQEPDGCGISDLKGVLPDGALVWAYTGEELTQLAPGEARHMHMKFGETVTCQNEGELLINGLRYSVKAGFKIESDPDAVIVKDTAGNVVAPLKI